MPSLDACIQPPSFIQTSLCRHLIRNRIILFVVTNTLVIVIGISVFNSQDLTWKLMDFKGNLWAILVDLLHFKCNFVHDLLSFTAILIATWLLCTWLYLTIYTRFLISIPCTEIRQNQQLNHVFLELALFLENATCHRHVHLNFLW